MGCAMRRGAQHKAALRACQRARIFYRRKAPVDASERHPDFKRELPHFLAEINGVFSLTELGSYIRRLERRTSLSKPHRFATRRLSSVFLVRRRSW